jgi:hypothetical protein
MLIFNSSDGKNNIIQLVMGPETQLQLDMSGCVKVNLQGLLENFDNETGLPFKLYITRSNNEQQTMKMLGIQSEPEHEPRYITTDEDTRAVDNTDEYHDDYSYSHPFGEYVKEIICPKCNEYGVFLKEDQPACCGDCLKIEKGLGNIPEKPKDKTDSKDDKESE